MKHSFKVSFLLLVIFIAAQVIGLMIVNSSIDTEASAKASQTEGRPVIVYEPLPYGLERPDVAPDQSYMFMAAAIIIGTLLLLLIIKLGRLSVWKIWFFIAVTTTLAVSFSALIPAMVAMAIAAAIAFFRAFRPNLLVHNISELFIYGGLAAIFVPIMNLKSAAILLVLISVYDIFAVFHSKHMITIAKFQSANNMFAGLFIPKDLSVPLTATIEKPVAKDADTGEFAVIGGGDIGFPLLFAGTTLATFGLQKALLLPFFAAAGLAALLYIGKKGKFYPAMPFIAAGCFAGYGVLLFTGNL